MEPLKILLTSHA